MTSTLTPNLLIMFSPRPPATFVPPTAERSNLPAYSGLSDFISEFEDPTKVEPIERTFPFETKPQRKNRLNLKKNQNHKDKLEEKIKSWEPARDTNATGDPDKTVFVGRLSYTVSESKLRREFEEYGPVKKVRIVTDSEGKPKGYAFVEYEKETSVKMAYRNADGKKIDDRRIVVDVERGRTDRSWRPRRLGGGLGYTRRGGKDVNQKFSGR
eukprot:TRINITY_DN408_c0_g1_i2.p1 TRINITY_DN408_c0_g1~~TRINITY_DN408_c0_g1_i2.p1  ORF type:complete len:212 (+),score=85.13 TRINITY_DN408_c0_g1_i2:83-718(+)